MPEPFNTASWAAMLIGLAWIWRLYSEMVDLAAERWLKLQTIAEAFGRMQAAEGGREPVRPDADDPLRSRFVFCGRWPEQGHAPTCPWQAVATLAVREDRP